MDQNLNEDVKVAFEPGDVLDTCKVGDHVDLRFQEETEGSKMIVTAIHEIDVGMIGNECRVYQAHEVHKVVRPGVYRRVTLMEAAEPTQDWPEQEDSEESL